MRVDQTPPPAPPPPGLEISKLFFLICTPPKVTQLITESAKSCTCCLFYNLSKSKISHETRRAGDRIDGRFLFLLTPLNLCKMSQEHLDNTQYCFFLIR